MKKLLFIIEILPIFFVNNGKWNCTDKKTINKTSKILFSILYCQMPKMYAPKTHTISVQILNLETLLIGMNVTIKLDENTDNDIMAVPNFSGAMLSEMYCVKPRT